MAVSRQAKLAREEYEFVRVNIAAVKLRVQGPNILKFWEPWKQQTLHRIKVRKIMKKTCSKTDQGHDPMRARPRRY